MEIFLGILGLLVMILGLLIAFIIISFFATVPGKHDEIGSAMRERNEIEKQKLKIMKNYNAKEKDDE